MSANLADLFSGPEKSVGQESDVLIAEVLDEHRAEVYAPDARDDESPCDCDLVAAVERNTRIMEEVVTAINSLGTTVQFMSDGTANMFGFFNSIGGDLATMSLGDKVKLISQMMKGS